MSKVQFNIRLDEDVALWIAEEAVAQTASLSRKISQADVVTGLVRRAMAEPTVSVKKESKKERLIRERAEGDVIAQRAERDNIDYSDIDSTPTTHVANLDVVGPTVASAQGKASVENWRATRKPLLKPKEQKQ